MVKTQKKLPSWMSTGKEAENKMNEEEERIANAGDRVFRLYMREGDDKVVTFLDGMLDSDGILAVPSFYEHQVYMNGSWQNFFPCTREEEEECPICDGGLHPSLVSLFTVIDHSKYVSKSGKTYENTKKLLAVKRQTFKLLMKHASKQPQSTGLAGCTFEVSRTSEKAPNVGDLWSFAHRSTKKDLAEKYGDVEPFDYEKVITYVSKDELKTLGFGSVAGAGVSSSTTADDDDYPF